MVIETLAIIFLAVASSAALAWCKDWVISVTRKYWGDKAAKMIDWALRVVLMVSLGQTWIDLLRNWEEYLEDLKEMFGKAARAVADTYFTVVEYIRGNENERKWEPVSVSTARELQEEMRSTSRKGIHKYVYKG